MSTDKDTSRKEEVIGFLTLITALILFHDGHGLWGAACLVKSCGDFLSAIVYAIKEANVRNTGKWDGNEEKQ